MKTYNFSLVAWCVLFFCFVFWLSEASVSMGQGPIPSVSGEGPMGAFSPMSPGGSYRALPPAALMRWKSDASRELREIQRTLSILDVSDVQLSTTLKERQLELLGQIREINTQLSTQGLPMEGEGPAPTLPNAPNTTLPTGGDLNFYSGGTLPSGTDPNLMIQRRMQAVPGQGPGMFPGAPMTNPNLLPQPPWTGSGAEGQNLITGSSQIPTGAYLPQNPLLTGPMPPNPPSDFDQDQAWADSPWNQRPSKELTELKQTIDLLRKELADMKESVKALETQIQLLNRNILLSR